MNVYTQNKLSLSDYPRFDIIDFLELTNHQRLNKSTSKFQIIPNAYAFRCLLSQGGPTVTSFPQTKTDKRYIYILT